jgi:hypothetical protein
LLVLFESLEEPRGARGPRLERSDAITLHVVDGKLLSDQN